MTPFLYIGISTATVLTLAAVFRIEDARGGSLVLFPRLRRWFDQFVRFTITLANQVYGYLQHSVLRLFFHYAAHRILKRLYRLTQYFEIRTEELLRQNRRTARRIGVEKKDRTHLDAMVEQKEKSALSRAQIEEMRSLD